MVNLTRGERFKDARIEFNCHGKQTMDQVASDTGIQKSMIQSLEDDLQSRSVGYDKIATLAKHYGVTSDYLLGLTNDPHRRPAATDDLGISAKAIKKIQMLNNASTEDRPYLGFLNFVLSSDAFTRFLYALYVDVHAHLAETVYSSVFSDEDETKESIITRIIQDQKYNSLISSYLRQMSRFDAEQSELERTDDGFQLDCSFSATDVVYLTRERTDDAYRALLRDTYNVASRKLAEKENQKS